MKKETLERLKAFYEEAKTDGQNMEDRDWGYQEGMIISYNEAQDVLDLQQRYDKLMRLTEAQGDYIKFLGQNISDNAVYLHVHNMGASNVTVEQGELLREKIRVLKAGLTSPDKTEK